MIGELDASGGDVPGTTPPARPKAALAMNSPTGGIDSVDHVQSAGVKEGDLCVADRTLTIGWQPRWSIYGSIFIHKCFPSICQEKTMK